MRYLICLFIHAVLLSSMAFGSTVFFKDGTKENGDSLWTENGKVYLSKSSVIYEYSSGEVKLEETLKFNRLGRYQAATPEKQRAVHTKLHRTQKHHNSKGKHAAKTPVTAVPALSTPAPAAAAVTKPTVPPSPAPTPVVAKAATPAPPPQPAAPTQPAPAPRVTAPVPPPVMSPTSAAMLFFTGAPVAMLLLILVVSILIIASYWMIYERAGQAGWKSLIPVYNLYILMLISGKPWWWMLLMFIPFVGIAVYLLTMLSLAKKFGRSELFGVGIFLLPIIFLPILAFSGSQYER